MRILDILYNIYTFVFNVFYNVTKSLTNGDTELKIKDVIELDDFYVTYYTFTHFHERYDFKVMSDDPSVLIDKYNLIDVHYNKDKVCYITISSKETGEVIDVLEYLKEFRYHLNECNIDDVFTWRRFITYLRERKYLIIDDNSEIDIVILIESSLQDFTFTLNECIDHPISDIFNNLN